MAHLVKNVKDAKYLHLWEKILKNDTVNKECRNARDIFEIMFLIPFTNPIVEHSFSKVN